MTIRAPLFTPSTRKKRHAVEGPPNLLLGTLNSPFFQREWNNPVIRKQLGGITVTANLLLTVLAISVAAPFSQNDWFVSQFVFKQTIPTIEVVPNLLISTLAITGESGTRRQRQI